MLLRSHALLIVLCASAVILAGCSPKPAPVAAVPALPPAPPPPVMPAPVVMDGRQQQAGPHRTMSELLNSFSHTPSASQPVSRTHAEASAPVSAFQRSEPPSTPAERRQSARDIISAQYDDISNRREQIHEQEQQIYIQSAHCPEDSVCHASADDALYSLQHEDARLGTRQAQLLYPGDTSPM